MTSTALESAHSEPLLSEEEEDFDALQDDSRFKADGSSEFRGLLASKYVVGCALFSSIGGLIFGYGIPSEPLASNSRPRSRLCDSGDAILQCALSFDSIDERDAHLLPRTRCILWEFDVFSPRG
jgi:hypothetical protein